MLLGLRMVTFCCKVLRPRCHHVKPAASRWPRTACARGDCIAHFHPDAHVLCTRHTPSSKEGNVTTLLDWRFILRCEPEFIHRQHCWFSVMKVALMHGHSVFWKNCLLAMMLSFSLALLPNHPSIHSFLHDKEEPSFSSVEFDTLTLVK